MNRSNFMDNLADNGLRHGGGLKKAALELKGTRALVVGLASTGVASARFLKKCGARVTAMDAKPLSELPEAAALAGLGVKIEAGGSEVQDADRAELVVVSPGVPYLHPVLEAARQRGAEVISEIELACRYIGAPVMAIAGTNGKTTTTSLIGKVLQDAGKSVFIGGNIGTPAIEYVSDDMERDYCVLEVSSFQLETTETFNPHIGVLLNITEDHLDRYTSFDHYARTKLKLFENQGRSDFAILNINDDAISRRRNKIPGSGRAVPFTVEGALEEGLSLRGGDIVYRPASGGAAEVYPTSGIRLKGLHNIENVMAVIAAARLCGVSPESIKKTLSEFEGLSHRMELVRAHQGVSYIDDSKGTNIGALVMALRGLNTPVVLLAGGRDKGGDYSVLSSLVKEKVKLMVLIGEARFKIKDALGALTKTVLAGTFEEAVDAARRGAAPGDTVLLCPACSSFDMFKSYKERGDRFKALVRAF